MSAYRSYSIGPIANPKTRQIKSFTLKVYSILTFPFFLFFLPLHPKGRKDCSRIFAEMSWSCIMNWLFKWFGICTANPKIDKLNHFNKKKIIFKSEGLKHFSCFRRLQSMYNL